MSSIISSSIFFTRGGNVEESIAEIDNLLTNLTDVKDKASDALDEAIRLLEIGLQKLAS